MTGITRLLILLLTLCLGFRLSAQENPLASGSWLKFAVSKTGVYRLNASDLASRGLNNISSNEIRVLSLPGGPLPQINDSAQPIVITDLPVHVEDGGDGIFNGNDYIIFYAEGPDILKYENGELNYEYNNYDRRNYVFIGSNGDVGIRIQDRSPVSSGGEVVTTCFDLQAHETSRFNLLSSGRTWYGERFDQSGTQNFSFDVPMSVEGGTVKVHSKVMAQSFGISRFNISINNIPAGEQVIDPVPDFLNPPSNNPFRYSVKGRENEKVFMLEVGSSQLTVGVAFDRAPVSVSTGYLDRLLLEAESRIGLTGDQRMIFSPEFQNGDSYTVAADAPEVSQIWDVSNLFSPFRIADLSVTASGISFHDQGSANKKYVIFNQAQLPAPEFISEVQSENFLSENPELLIIVHPDFLAAARRLEAFRESDNMSVSVVTTEQVFDLLGSGRADPSAIRNLARIYYSMGSLKYLLLFGKGSFDYLGVLPFQSNFVPGYQSRNSLDPLDTYTSDDFFGFLEEGEGEWPEQAGGNHTLEIGIGRIPVTTAAEAKDVVDKIIRYGSSATTLGNWRRKYLFVADDADFNLHHRQSDNLASLMDTSDLTVQNRRLFLGSFRQQTTGGGESSPDASAELLREINNGALIVNYTGHGNESSWTQEQIFTLPMISSLRNKDRLPLFITATCEFGRHDDPREVSGAELLVSEPGGGAIAILSTCRPVFSSSNFNLNEAFFNALLENSARLGDIIRITKNNSVDLATDARKVGNRNFSLLGDPSVRLAVPENRIEVTRITADSEESDTLRAGSLVNITGRIVGFPAFNGTIDVRLRDKPVDVKTIDQPVYSYEERLNTLFNGSAKVENGRFEISFIIPKNISNKSGYAQLFMYAYDKEQLLDASGAYDKIVTSGSAGESADTAGPEIKVFFGDSTNTSRTNVNHNTLVFVKLKDASGINTSGFGIGNNIEATLDGNQTFVLNEYYQALPGTFREGWVIFPLDDLSEGLHTLTFRAWDVFNNSGEVTVTFEVADPGTLIIKDLKNFPNPFVRETTISFSHNRSGEDLEIWVTVMNRNGQIVSETQYLAENSGSLVTLPPMESESYMKNLSPGLYVYGVRVRSRLDGASDLKYQKMMLIN